MSNCTWGIFCLWLKQGRGKKTCHVWWGSHGNDYQQAVIQSVLPELPANVPGGHLEEGRAPHEPTQGNNLLDNDLLCTDHYSFKKKFINVKEHDREYIAYIVLYIATVHWPPHQPRLWVSVTYDMQVTNLASDYGENYISSGLSAITESGSYRFITSKQLDAGQAFYAGFRGVITSDYHNNINANLEYSFLDDFSSPLYIPQDNMLKNRFSTSFSNRYFHSTFSTGCLYIWLIMKGFAFLLLTSKIIHSISQHSKSHLLFASMFSFKYNNNPHHHFLTNDLH